MAVTNFYNNTILQVTLRSLPISFQPMYLGLWLNSPGASGTGTEVSGIDYIRQYVQFSLPNGSYISTNEALIDYGIAGGYWGIITNVALLDSIIGGNMLVYETVTNVEVSAGDRVRFPIGNITATIA